MNVLWMLIPGRLAEKVLHKMLRYSPAFAQICVENQMCQWKCLVDDRNQKNIKRDWLKQPGKIQ